MPRFNYLKNNMTAGQIGPVLAHRAADLQRIQNGVRTLQNLTVMPEGGVTTRPGTKYLHEVKDSSALTILLPFEFNTEQVYGIEVGAGYFRFMKETGLILESDITITGITQANPAVITVSGTAPADGDQVFLSEIVGMTELNDANLYYTVANRTATTFEVQDRDGNNVDSSAFTAYSSGGVVNVIYTIANPYSESDLLNLEIAQSADVITFTHGDYAPRDLTRTGDTAWTFVAQMKDSDSPSATLVFEDGPYGLLNTETTTLGLSGTTGSVTVTASAVTGINEGQGFLSTDVGRLIRWKDGSDWTWLEITAVGGTTSVTATIKGEDAAVTTATTDWRLGSWSDTTGFPRAVAYFQQRKVYGGSATYPDTVWGSRVEDYPDFSPTDPDGVVDDSHAWQYVLSQGKVESIYWLTSGTKLRIGTEARPWTLWSGSDNLSITPTRRVAEPEEPIRCKQVTPIDLGDTTLYAQKSGKKLRELVYNFQADKLAAPNLSSISDDILGDLGDTTDVGIKQMVFSQEPYPIAWMCTDEGKLVGLTYSRENEVVGWHSHTLGGDAIVESVMSLPFTGQDIIYVICKRTIDGVTRRYVEKMDTIFRGKTVQDARFVDSGIQHLGEAPDTTLTPGATTGTAITFTAVAANTFSASDVGRRIRNNATGETGDAEIVGYTSDTVVTADIVTDFTDTNAIASGDWVLSTDTVTGLDHLEGMTVSILADGGVHPERTVSSGSITLDGQYIDKKVGLGYTQIVELLDVDFGSAIGTAYGEPSKISTVTIEFFESMGGEIGYDSTTMTPLLFRQGDDIMDTGVPLFTGSKVTQPIGGFQNSIKTRYVNSDPLPVTILSFVIKGTVSEK